MFLRLGPAVRTNNFSDAQLTMKLQQLWKDAPPVRPIYVCYFHYADRFTEDFSVALGVEDPDGTFLLPSEQTSYITYPIPLKERLGFWKAWQNAWEDECTGRIERSYTVDFEKYEADGSATLYIAGAVNPNVSHQLDRKKVMK